VANSHAFVVTGPIRGSRDKIADKPAQETGLLAFALRKVCGAWKISAMAWAKLTDTRIP